MTLPEQRGPVAPNARTPDDAAVPPLAGTARNAPVPSARPADSASPSERRKLPGEAPAAAESSSDTSRSAKKTRTTTPPLKSYADLLRAVYGPARRRWKPTHKEIGEIQGSKLHSAEREVLLDLAASDVTLKKTRDLMLFGTKRLDGPNGDRPIRSFVRDVLHRHPAYQSKSLSATLARAHVPLERRTVHVLTTEARRWHERSELPKHQRHSCIANALHCLLLWHGEDRSSSASLQDVLGVLREELWISFTKRRTSELDKLRALVEDRDPYATSIACSGLSGQILQLRRQLNESRASTRELEASLNAVNSQLQETKDQLKDADTRSTGLDHELGTARESHANETAHLRDTLEKLRSSVVRRLKAELSLLSDGLHALRRDPPKVSVMDDHAERAIDGLTRELERLQD